MKVLMTCSMILMLTVAQLAIAQPQREKGSNGEFYREIRLTAVTAGDMILGEAEIESDMEGNYLEQEVEVEIAGAQPNTDYRIVVRLAGAEPVELGSVTTNTRGSAEVTFSSSPGEGRMLQLPANKTVRDFESMEVMRGDTAVLRGTFK